MIPRFSRYLTVAGTAAVAAFAAVAVLAPPTAEAQTTIGQRNNGSVSVDLSVLDQLGNTPNVPQLFRPSVRSLLMPNTRSQRGSRFTPLNRPQAAAPAGVQLKPPARTQRKTATRRTTAKAAPRRAIRKPVVPKAAPPPPPPKISAPRPTAPKTAAPLPPKAVPAPPALAKAPPAPPPVPAPAARATSVPAPPPAPAIVPPKAAPKAPKQTASLPPQSVEPGKSGGLTPGQQFRIGFDSGNAAIGAGQSSELDGIAKSMKQNGALRLQLLSYAGGASQTPSQARRLSLSRALAVRSRLIEQGVRSTRIDVRALGNKSEGGPPDRVDVIITTR